VTEVLLSMSPGEISGLRDYEESTARLLKDYEPTRVDHRGPFVVEVVESACKYFGIEYQGYASLSALTPEMLLDARERAGLPRFCDPAPYGERVAVSFSWRDLRDLVPEKWSDRSCERWLVDNHREISDALVKAGNEAIEQLLLEQGVTNERSPELEEEEGPAP
jgi:hypothetical protein